MRCLTSAALVLWLLAVFDVHGQHSNALTLPIAPACPPCPPPAPHTLWSFLGLSGHNVKKCRAAFCCSNLGRMCDSMVAPLHHASGGIVPRICCDLPSREDIACMCAGNCSLAELAAAKIKRDAAEACARRAAVRFLGTVDCHYYHEAEEALIAHLRADQNECVRLEAAQVLAKGCCCTPRTIAALKAVVDGTAEDGNPPERSERVRSAAMQALETCLASESALFVPQQAPLQTPPLEVLPPPAPQAETQVQLTGFWVKPPRTGTRDILLEAQRSYAARVGATTEEQPSRRGGSLLEIVTQASIPAEQPVAARETPQVNDPPPARAPNPSRDRDLYRLDLAPIGMTPLGIPR